MVRLVFWRGDFRQGEAGWGWGKWLEPVAFSRPETTVVSTGAGTQEPGSGRTTRT